MRKVLWPLLLVLVYGCDIFDKDETIPGFVYIQKSDVITNPETEGANTSNIYDATVFADGEFMGTFELPASVPILKNGNTEITVGAGIKNNGLGSDRRIYPFYDFYITTLNLIPNVVTPINSDSIITYQYFQSGLNFNILSFETIGTELIEMPTNTAEITKTTDIDEVLSGGGCLKILMDQERSEFFATTSWNLQNLPVGSNMYVEIDFRGNHYLEVGILSQNPQRTIFAAGINATDAWTKLYIGVTDEISPLVNADPLEIYFRSILNPNEPDKTLFIDNIKFITP